MKRQIENHTLDFIEYCLLGLCKYYLSDDLSLNTQRLTKPDATMHYRPVHTLGLYNFSTWYTIQMFQSHFLFYVSKIIIVPKVCVVITCPLPKRPCVSTRLITVSWLKSTWSHSYESRDTGSRGHQAPPFFSVRILKAKVVTLRSRTIYVTLLIIKQNSNNVKAYLALKGPTLFSSYEELAESWLSVMSPVCMPKSWRHVATQPHRNNVAMQSNNNMLY